VKLSDIVLVTRIIRIVFGGLAGLMLLAAVSDILSRGHLTIISPVNFGALLAVALAFLVQNMLVAREKSEMLTAQAQQLKQFAGRLEASLKNAATINARLNQSEIRYKGLVDAQGDAIFRRDASSRLTYGNAVLEDGFRCFGGRHDEFHFFPSLCGAGRLWRTAHRGDAGIGLRVRPALPADL